MPPGTAIQKQSIRDVDMRVQFIKKTTVVIFGTIPCLAMIGCAGSSGYTAASTVPTTRNQTILPIAVPLGAPQDNPRDVALYGSDGYSAFQIGAGEDQGRKFDLMPSSYSGAANATRLLTFFSMSDVHITDKESPAQVPFVGWNASYQAGAVYCSAYSPVLISTTQVLDAAVKTINSLHRQSPFDFGLCLGDVTNNTQYNELRWFIDVMDGRYITPSSGAHVGARTIDYQMPFQAAGLNRSIPWYQVVGNHDQYFMGANYVSDKIRNALVGSEVLNMAANIMAPNSTEGSGMYVGVIDGSTPYGNVIKGGITADFATPPTVVADPNRRSVTTATSTTDGYINEFFNSRTSPSGHGFSRGTGLTTDACYTFIPKSNLPLKVIVLDDTFKTTSGGGGPASYASGAMDTARFTWLTTELQKGQDAGQLMIIACHIPIRPQKDLFDTTPSPQWYPGTGPSETDVLTALHNYPNLVLLLAGHRHMNVVTPQPSPDSAHPENGFWEVETASLRDFPRHFRTFDIIRNVDNTISIMATDIDPVTTPGSVAAKSLGYAIGAEKLFGALSPSDTSSHAYNAELLKQLTPAMQAKIAAYGSTASKSVKVSSKK